MRLAVLLSLLVLLGVRRPHRSGVALPPVNRASPEAGGDAGARYAS